MSRVLRILLAVGLMVLFSLALSSAAGAAPTSSNQTGPGTSDGGNCTGCSPGKVTYNDPRNFRWEGFEFTGHIYREFAAKADPAANRGVKKTSTLELGLGATQSYNGLWRGAAHGRGMDTDINLSAFNDIGIFTRCPLGPANKLLSNPMSLKRPACYFNDPGSHTRWWEVHKKAPNADATPQGGTQFIALRMWRSCQVVLNDKGEFTGYRDGAQTKSTCKRTPIVERIPPLSDDVHSDAWIPFWNYLRVKRRPDGVPVADHNAPEATSHTASVAGMLYNSASVGGGGRYVGTHSKASNFQKACSDGVLGGNSSADWSKDEMLGELEFRKTHDAWFSDKDGGHYEAIKKWITKDNKKWPISTMTAYSGNKLCDAFSEYINLSWSLGALTKDKKGARVSWSGNLIPGRMYLATYAYLDARENVVTSQLEFFASRSELDTERVLPKVTSKQATGSATMKIPKAGFVGVLGEASATSRGEPPSQDREKSTRGECPPVDKPEDPNKPRNELCPAFVKTEWDEKIYIEPLHYSLWLPRAAAVGLYNPRDAGGGEAQYKKTHYLRSNRAKAYTYQLGLGRADSGPDRLFAPFVDGDAVAKLGPAIKSLNQPLIADRLPLFSVSIPAGPAGLSGTAKVITDRTTEVPVSNGGPTGLTEFEKVQGHETRALAVVGENRWQAASWKVGEEVNTKRAWMRLTMDSCDTELNGKPVLVPRLVEGPCDPGAYIAGSLWQVKDAYRVPAVTKGSPARYLEALFTQERSGPATLKLVLPPAVVDRVSAIKVFTAQNYQAGQGSSYTLDNRALGALGQSSMKFTDDEDDLRVPVNTSTGTPASELPAGAYVVRFIIDGQPGYPAFNWGVLARVWTNTKQDWVSRFDVHAAGETVPIYRARTAG